MTLTVDLELLDVTPADLAERLRAAGLFRSHAQRIAGRYAMRSSLWAEGSFTLERVTVTWRRRHDGVVVVQVKVQGEG